MHSDQNDRCYRMKHFTPHCGRCCRLQLRAVAWSRVVRVFPEAVTFELKAVMIKGKICPIGDPVAQRL